MTSNFNLSINNHLTLKTDIPHIVKYMGSKGSLLEYLHAAISELYEGETVCDLFAGTAILGGALGQSAKIISNDIQEYSSVFAKTYLGDYKKSDFRGVVKNVIELAEAHVSKVKSFFPHHHFDYNKVNSLEEFQELEKAQQDLINQDFDLIQNHLFIKYYSGTYWSYEQCLWIDGLRAAAESYKNKKVYYPILSSLMFAMSYNAQSTGHYAQYRDANSASSMKDIAIYRKKEIVPYFERKFKELQNWSSSNPLKHHVTTLDYTKCLEVIPSHSIVYADPPYAFVHYSRFYHAMETLVKYDYPDVSFKGRYRDDRHQSPFCKRTEVKDAFQVMFQKVKDKDSKLILSYSNTGMISLEDIMTLAKETFGPNYKVDFQELAYLHSTMGRKQDKTRKVKELLIIAVPR